MFSPSIYQSLVCIDLFVSRLHAQACMWGVCLTVSEEEGEGRVREMMRDKALTPGISCWDKSAARSWGPLLGDWKGEGSGKRERRRWGWGTPNTEAQFMRNRWRVDWMTLWGKERKKGGKKGAHKAVRVQPSFLYHWLSVYQMPGGVSARKCFSDRPTCVLHIFRCV